MKKLNFANYLKDFVLFGDLFGKMYICELYLDKSIKYKLL